jgi:hypothetical protein
MSKKVSVHDWETGDVTQNFEIDADCISWSPKLGISIF